MESVPAAHPSRAGSLRIFLCGDVMTGRGIDQVLPHPGDPELREPHVRSALAYVGLAERANGPLARPKAYSDIWGAARDFWRELAPDLRLMNLETAVTTSGDFAPKGVNYRMNPGNLPALAASEVDACALANNHVLDFGPDGLAETLDVLHAHGVATAGAGRTLEDARRPAILTAGSSRVLFYSLASGDSGVPKTWAAGPARPGVDVVGITQAAADDLTSRVSAARRPGDVVVVSIHWGSNWGYQVPESHRQFAHALIDSGQISIVHGHSSHHPRPIEVYRDRLILYGCGDFLNDYEGIRGYEDFRCELVSMYFADVDVITGALRALYLAPLQIRRFQLQRPDPTDVAWLAGVLSEKSGPFGVALKEGSRGLLEARWTSRPRASPGAAAS
jgi:poly-gamma-glutamate capsule biosynthesis protein CapA/YwtB (metallophosphatase superfamily)